MNRKEFLGAMLATGAAGALKATASAPAEKAPARLVAPSTEPRNPRPYANVDWKSVRRINTTSHGHCESQEMLDAYLRHKFEFITISNYYPSAPRMPGKTITKDFFRFHQTHQVNFKGQWVDPPKDWNEIIGRHPEYVDDQLKSQLPLREKGELMFPNWPDGLLEAPNAEHHHFLLPGETDYDVMIHLCAPGSAFASGTFDKWGMFGTMKQGWCTGVGEFWGTAIDRMIAGLIVPDGGGVTINHPTWSQLDRGLLLQLLDWDSRVLGIEVLEAGHNSEHYWDWVLATGRQCFGFFVPDWSVGKDVFGVNVLLVKAKTVEDCLRAYRQGNFYGAAHGLGELNFTYLGFDGEVVRATVDRPARLEVKTARGVVKSVLGTEIEWRVPEHREWQGAITEVFARVKAYATDGSGEELFSQPFILGGRQAIW